MYVCVYIYIHTYTHIMSCIYVYMCICICVYMCMCAYIYIYIYIHMYTQGEGARDGARQVRGMRRRLARTGPLIIIIMIVIMIIISILFIMCISLFIIRVMIVAVIVTMCIILVCIIISPATPAGRDPAVGRGRARRRVARNLPTAMNYPCYDLLAQHIISEMRFPMDVGTPPLDVIIH